MPEKLLQLIKGIANKKLFNAVLFQLGWFACVLGGDAIAFAVTVFILCVHQIFFVNKAVEWYLIASVAMTGFMVDNILSRFGIFTFQSPSMLFIPLWLACLWVLFATTLSHSLAWLKNRLWLAAVLGAFFGPVSYWVGSKIANVVLSTPPTFSLLSISVCWAILLPAFFALVRHQQTLQ